MNIEYYQLVDNSVQSQNVKALYKENTNVLAYYVITLILIENYQSFLNWCITNNDTLIKFKKTKTNQTNFIIFIETHYKKKSFLNNIECVKKTYDDIVNSDNIDKKDKTNILQNFRMTAVEFV